MFQSGSKEVSFEIQLLKNYEFLGRKPFKIRYILENYRTTVKPIRFQYNRYTCYKKELFK